MVPSESQLQAVKQIKDKALASEQAATAKPLAVIDGAQGVLRGRIIGKRLDPAFLMFL